MKKVLVLIVSVLAFMPSVLFAESNNFGISGMDVFWGYAPINGYVQTPAGGRLGTSDIKRPTFDELGIEKENLLNLELRWVNKKYLAYIGSTWINMSSSGVLEKDLMSRTQFFEGERFNTDINFNWYRFGVGRNLGYFTPKVEVAILDFSYELSTPSTRIERSYAKPTLRVGVEKQIKFNNFGLDLESSISLPASNTPTIFTAGAVFKYWFTKRFNLGLVVNYLYIDYEDNQEFPNHLRLEMLPITGISLGYAF